MVLASTSVHVVEWSSPNWLLPVSKSPEWSFSHFLPLQETLQDQQVGLTQAPFRLLLLPWVLENVRFCVCPLRIESVFPTALWSPKSKTHWPSRLNILGAPLPNTGLLGSGAQWGAQTPRSLGRTSAIVITLPFVCQSPWDMGLCYTMTPPLLPDSLWFLLYIFSCSDLFW